MGDSASPPGFGPECVAMKTPLQECGGESLPPPHAYPRASWGDLAPPSQPQHPWPQSPQRPHHRYLSTPVSGTWIAPEVAALAISSASCPHHTLSSGPVYPTVTSGTRGPVPVTSPFSGLLTSHGPKGPKSPASFCPEMKVGPEGYSRGASSTPSSP